MAEPALPSITNGNSAYTGYSYADVFWSVLPSILFYTPTIVLFIMMAMKVVEANRKRDYGQLIIGLMVVLSINLLTTFTDSLVSRFVSSGFVTSSCSSNHFLKWLELTIPVLLLLSRMAVIAFSYIRSVSFFCPYDYRKYNYIAVAIVSGASLVLMILFIFIITPELGYCKQMPVPYPIGSIEITVDMNLRAHIIHIGSLVIMTVAMLISIVPLYEIRRRLMSDCHQRNTIRTKCETPMNWIIVCLSFVFIFDLIFAITRILFPNATGNVLMVRSIVLDFATAIVPWIAFKIHPVFRTSRVGTQRSSVAWIETHM